MTTQQKLIASLKYLLGEQKDIIIGIVNPLRAEKQQQTMLEYLSENQNNKELMRTDRLLKKALEIAKN